MIDEETLVQLKALSEENQSLREDISVLTQKLDANNQSIVDHVETELAKLRDVVTRAANDVAAMSGKLDVFTEQQEYFKTEFAWWGEHFDTLESQVGAALKDMADARAAIEADNSTFRDWATTKITQIGRVFRR